MSCQIIVDEAKSENKNLFIAFLIFKRWNFNKVEMRRL